MCPEISPRVSTTPVRIIEMKFSFHFLKKVKFCLTLQAVTNKYIVFAQINTLHFFDTIVLHEVI